MNKYIVSRDDELGIVWFTINRPDKRNAIDYDVMDGLALTISEVEKEENDKILVITGAGDKAFCAGGDLTAFQTLFTQEDAYQMLSKMGTILYSLATLSKPTVALLNGLAIGGGCELATACDYRLASSGSRVGFVQGSLGITTGWGGASLLLERVPSTTALEMLLSGSIYSAQEAYELGFINQLVSANDTLGESNHFITSNIAHSTKVINAYKKVVNTKFNSTGLKERMFEEIKECSRLWASEEHHKAVYKFIQKN
ncbi:enoyl-CoA hydratase/isomerase family protein [Fredinandcohnia sp. 179-A 10B2 NHS]|uniref:enoyl-CoA hydratase/isomerase family protein n=1 Tax=Fredinandcohnia sp. 179-A 10B2 NHS TaxID=3235176 RepID=UPI00399FFE36